MSFSRIIRIGVASALVGILSACGGGGSSSDCPSSNPNCNDNLLGLNGLGADGPLAQALVSVHALQDFILDPATAENLLSQSDLRSDDDGLANDLILGRSANANQYVLRFTVDAQTRDTTTGATGTDIPFSEVYTIVDADRLSPINPNDPASTPPVGRFYATALTKLAVDIAIAQGALGTGTSGDLDAPLAAAAQSALEIFGFGADVTMPLFGDSTIAIPPILDETTEGDDTRVGNVAAYRLALEMYAQLVENLITDSNGFSNDDDITAEIAAQLGASGDGQLDTGAGPNEQALIDAINAANVDAISPVDSNPNGISDLLDERFGSRELLDILLGDDINGVTPEGSELPSSTVGVIQGIMPEAADFDGDGEPNSSDDQPNDPDVVVDADGDGVDDVGGGVTNPNHPAGAGSPDNCPAAVNGPAALGVYGENQEDTDGDGAGDSCDADADNDGVNGTLVAPFGTDIDDQDQTIATDIDGDGIDDVGGGTFNPQFGGAADNCLPGVLFGDASPFENPPFNAAGVDDIPNITITNLLANNPGQENIVAGPDGILDTADDVDDGDGIGIACDEDADGDGAPGDGFGGSGVPVFGIGLGDPDDTDGLFAAADQDLDGANDDVDTCPGTPNGPLAGITDEQGINNTNSTVNANGSVFGPSCDFDDDGFPDDGTQDLSGITDIADNIDPDNCPLDANPDPGQFSQADDNDGDGLGGICDNDDDDDGIPDLRDPSPLVSLSTYLFDTFYLQQSDDNGGTGDFKLATLSESAVIQTAGTIVAVAGTDHILDVGTDTLNDNTYNITTAYQTVENSIVYSGAGFVQATPPNATPTSVVNDRVSPAGVSVTTIVSYSEPNLNFGGGTLYPWGSSSANSSFVGSGVNGTSRPDTPALGAPLTNVTEQALTSLIYIDQTTPPTDATLNGTYGFVDMVVDYGSTTADLVQINSRMFDLALDGSGAVTTGTNSEYSVSIGSSNGTVAYATTAVPETGYSVALGTGAVTLTDTGLVGIAANDGELIALSNDNSRGYGVKLDVGNATIADLVAQGPYDLTGLVLQPDVDSLASYTLNGATLSFADAGAGNITATLSYGSSTRASAAYAASDMSLPVTGSVNNPAAGVSETFTMDADGRLDRIIFGAGAAKRQADLEGYFVPGKGLLLRWVETNFTEQGTGVAEPLLFIGSLPSGLVNVGGTGACSDLGTLVNFVDPATEIPLAPQPTCPSSGLIGGFVLPTTGTGTLTRISQLARDNSPTPQDFNVLVTPADTNLTGDGFGQGIVFGIPQNAPAP